MVGGTKADPPVAVELLTVAATRCGPGGEFAPPRLELPEGITVEAPVPRDSEVVADNVSCFQRPGFSPMLS